MSKILSTCSSHNCIFTSVKLWLILTTGSVPSNNALIRKTCKPVMLWSLYHDTVWHNMNHVRAILLLQFILMAHMCLSVWKSGLQLESDSAPRPRTPHWGLTKVQEEDSVTLFTHLTWRQKHGGGRETRRKPVALRSLTSVLFATVRAENEIKKIGFFFHFKQLLKTYLLFSLVVQWLIMWLRFIGLNLVALRSCDLSAELLIEIIIANWLCLHWHSVYYENEWYVMQNLYCKAMLAKDVTEESTHPHTLVYFKQTMKQKCCFIKVNSSDSWRKVQSLLGEQAL